MRWLLVCSFLLTGWHATMAQSLTQLPNADFSHWDQAEPVGWQTNNVYDEQRKLMQTVVVPAGTTGARLLAKRVIYRPDPPALESWYAGQLSSPLVPFMPPAGKPVALTIHYRFRPDSADVLRAEIQLDTRDLKPRSTEPDPACICRFAGINGPILLPANQTSVTLKATFSDPASPDQVPRSCSLYVWKIRFWLENPSTHAHEATEAVIDQITLEP